jgi:chitinase
MRTASIVTSLCFVPLLALSPHVARAQGTAPTFQRTVGQNSYTLLGRDPAQPVATTIPVVLVPIALSFESKKSGGKPFVMDAAPDVPRLLASPVFSKYAFTNGGSTQFADAMLRATFPKAEAWHTLFGKPEVKPIKIAVPAGYGYVLSSKKGGYFAVLDVQFVQKEIFKQIPKQDGKLVIAVTPNATYYADADATECCSWGTHGVDSATGNSFVLGSYLHAAPAVVEDGDLQPLTQQLGEFVNDPLHDPLARGGRGVRAPGNLFPGWARPASQPGGDQGGCGGTGVATQYFLLEPTNTNPKNNIPASKGYVAQIGSVSYRLQNVALLPWYVGASEGLGETYSFPDAHVLSEPAHACAAGRGRGAGGGGGGAAGRGAQAPPQPTVPPAPLTGPPNGHGLIGYYSGYSGNTASLRDISPQWDVIIVAFSTPDHNPPEGTMQFRAPAGQAADQFKADIAYKKSLGKKVLISLGGGGVSFTLASPQSVPLFVSTVGKIISDWGFDGIDIDFETPSLVIDPGDTDFKHPTTPSIVNLISAMRQLHDRFGPGFMISLVPEGTQIISGYPSYGGQFGSYLPIAYGIRDILSFVDTQDYNTPPLEGLDGEIYQPGTVDYHAAMTELELHGFNVGGDPKQFFPPLAANKVAVGFLTGDTNPAIVSQAMEYIITGKAPAGTHYKLLKPDGYAGMMGAMFWTLDADRRANYNYSNVVGPQLHAYPAAK